MALVRNGAKIIAFIHIPKTGGNSIHGVLRKLGPLALNKGGPHEWARCSVRHLHRDAFAEAVPPDFIDHAFTVVRDPVERLRSEFRYRATGWLRMRERNGKPKETGHPDGTYRVKLGSGSAITDFEGFVPLALQELEKDAYANDNHLRPQVDFLFPGLRVFRFEDGLEPVLTWLAEITDTDPASLGDVPHHNPSWDLPAPLSLQGQAMIKDRFAEDYALMENLRAVGPGYVVGAD